MLIQTKSITKSKGEYVFLKALTGLVSLYFSIVLYMSIYGTLEYIYLLLIFFFVIFMGLTKLCYSWSSSPRDCLIPKQTFSVYTLFVTTFLVVFLGHVLYWFAFYPGGFNLDAYGQWDQVHGLQKLNNWHPILTTGVYWVLTRICDSFAFCIFVQLLFFSASISVLLVELYRYNVPIKFLLFSAVYISLSPAIGMNNICLFKDVPFAIVLIWVTIILLRIIESNGKWLESMIHVVLLSVNMVALCMIRHNGIFLVAPICLGLIILFHNQRKHAVISALMYVIIFLFIQGPVFSHFEVEEHSNFTGESVGVPMAIMVNNYVESEELTPPAVKALLLSIANKEEWKEHYVLGEWDSCKWEFGGIELFQDEEVGDILQLALSSVWAAPESAYQSVRENTRVVWQIIGFSEWDTWVYIEENDYGIYESPNILCTNIVNVLLACSLTLPGTFLFWNIGLPNAILMLLSLFVTAKRNYENILLLLPTICYNVMTMLLLCGPSHRYFYFNSVLIVPITLYLLTANNK